MACTIPLILRCIDAFIWFDVETSSLVNLLNIILQRNYLYQLHASRKNNFYNNQKSRTCTLLVSWRTLAGLAATRGPCQESPPWKTLLEEAKSLYSLKHIMVLKQLNKVVVRFSPWADHTSSAREFLARCTAPKAMASNPDLKVEVLLRIKGDPYVEVEYNNKQVERFASGHLNVEQLMFEIKARSAALTTMELLKKGGMEGQLLESPWDGNPGKTKQPLGESGLTFKVPVASGTAQ